MLAQMDYVQALKTLDDAAKLYTGQPGSNASGTALVASTQNLRSGAQDLFAWVITSCGGTNPSRAVL